MFSRSHGGRLRRTRRGIRYRRDKRDTRRAIGHFIRTPGPVIQVEIGGLTEMMLRMAENQRYVWSYFLTGTA